MNLTFNSALRVGLFRYICPTLNGLACFYPLSRGMGIHQIPVVIGTAFAMNEEFPISMGQKLVLYSGNTNCLQSSTSGV